MTSPRFTIGITTYRRLELLSLCLKSVLAQSCQDFEVLVGNDAPDTPISFEALGLADLPDSVRSRVKLINRPANLGELGNMNAMLKDAKGQFFTWLADDDLYAPTFLSQADAALRAHPDAKVVFSNYAMGDRLPDPNPTGADGTIVLTGREFLGHYMRRDLRVLGCYGVWETELLRRQNGMEKLGTGFSPYSDNLLTIRAGLLPKVLYLEPQLILFRTHSESLSWASDDLDSYISAQRDLCAHSLEVFSNETLSADLEENLYQLLSHWCVKYFYEVAARKNKVAAKTYASYFAFIESVSRKTGKLKYLLLLRALAGARIPLRARFT